jgi:hypothetical protein
VISTIHPPAVLRGPDARARESSYAGLAEDLVAARKAAGRAHDPAGRGLAGQAEGRRARAARTEEADS